MTLPPMPPLPVPSYHEDEHVSDQGYMPCDVWDEYRVRLYAEQYGRLCAEAEREACAKLADEIAEKHLNSGHYISIVGDRAARAGGQVDGAKESARAIRLRGQR